MRRILSLLTAIISLTALAILPAASASASPDRPPEVTAVHFVKIPVHVVNGHAVPNCGGCQGLSLCLTNTSSPPYCAWDSATITNTVISALTLIATVWGLINKGRGDGGTEEEGKGQGQTEGDQDNDTENQGDEGVDSAGDGFCMQSTGGNVTWAACGSNGTVWIEKSFRDGISLENRYVLDHTGNDEILTVASPTNGDHLYVHAAGTGWQTWSWGFAVTEQCSPYGCP